MNPLIKDSTIVDVAREAGVSIKTVSRVVNVESGVHEETRARIAEVIQRLNYRPKRSARSLKSGRSYLLGLFYYEPQSAYAGNLQRGATLACREAGYHLVVESLEQSVQTLGQQIERTLATLRPDGVILTPGLCDDARVLTALKNQSIPAVRLSPRADRGLVVRINEVRAAEELTQHLLDLGHRSIGFLRGPADQVASAWRLSGYEAAMAAAGLQPAWLGQGDFTFESGLAAAHTLLTLGNRPSAIFAANDDMALGLMAGVEAQGLRVPQDLSLVGFDDTPAATRVWPTLTTVRQPMEAMAIAAVQSLLGLPATAAGTQVLPHELKLRASSAQRR